MQGRNRIRIDHDKIRNEDTKETIAISNISKTGLKIKPVRINALNTIMNSTANFLSNSLSNGNELVDIYLQIVLKNNTVKDYKLNLQPVVRNNLDYHQIVKEGRKLSNDIKEIMLFSQKK